MKLPVYAKVKIAAAVNRIEKLRTPGSDSGPSDQAKKENQVYVDSWILPLLRGILKDDIHQRKVTNKTYRHDQEDARDVLIRLKKEGPQP